MSIPHYTSHSDSWAAQEAGGYSPTQERSYGHTDPLDAQGDREAFSNARYPQLPQFRQEGDPRTPHLGSRSLPRRQIVIISSLAALALALGGYSAMSQINLGAVQTKADGLSESLARTKDALTGKQAELEKTRQQMDASSQKSASAIASLEVATNCATQLLDAWVALGKEDMQAVQTSLDAAKEPCNSALGDGASQ
jgi:hypothetical protein